MNKRKSFSALLMAVLFVLVSAQCAMAQKLTGAGSTFDYPIFAKWFSEYSQAHPGVEINYQSIGSGGGIQQVSNGLVDFGASDGPMTDAQLAQSKVKLVHIPVVLGADVPAFNVPGVTNLRFSGETLANIYLGKIKTWNDPRIAQDNPNVKLPAMAITVVHRADGSGTTYIFVDYLSKVSPEWKSGPGVGTSINWPVGIGGKGNEGVTGLLRQIPGSIGYIELTYALQNHISFGTIKNAAGNWVSASIAGVTEAASSVKNMPSDFRVSITNAPGATAYPISSFSWMLVPVKAQDAAKGRVLRDFLNWMVKSGESQVSSLYYAPLPENVAQKVLKVVYSLQ